MCVQICACYNGGVSLFNRLSLPVCISALQVQIIHESRYVFNDAMRTFFVQAMNAMTSDKTVCDQVVKTELHRDMLADLKTLSADTANKPRSSVRKEFVQRQVSTLHNVARNAETARTAFRQHGAVNVMQKFRNVDEFAVFFSLVS